MFGDITRFLLDTLFTLFGAALLLRAWTQAVRLSPRNPLSQSIFQLTGWLVHPLRRIIPATGYIDWSSLVAAYLTALAYLCCWWQHSERARWACCRSVSWRRCSRC